MSKMTPAPYGEAWVSLKRPAGNGANRVAEGVRLKGNDDLTADGSNFQRQWLGAIGGAVFRRFPLLLKFLDVQQMLSVQVHPRTSRRTSCPEGEDRQD